MATDIEAVALASRRAPLLVAAVVLAVTALALVLRDVPIPNDRVVLPLWLVLVATFTMLTLSVLVAQYRADPDPRVLMLTCALLWSLLTITATLVVVPGVVSHDALVSRPAAIPTLWALRHLGIPALLAAALLPWTAAFTGWLTSEHSGWTLLRVHAGVAALAVLCIWLLAVQPVDLHLVVLVDGRYAPVAWVRTAVAVVSGALTLAGLGGFLVRRQMQGIERWALVALVADFGDTALTWATGDVATLAWYAARVMGLAAAAVLLSALLREIDRLQRSTRSYAVEVEEKNAALTEAQGLRDHLVAVVSHDMRSPLAGLSGYLEVLEGADDLRPEEMQQMHARSRMLTRRLIMLTEDLLASATPHGLQVIAEPLVLRRQLDDCTAAFPELTVLVHCPADLEVLADPLRLQQVLANLVRNAQKYGAEPVRIHCVRLGGSRVQISVTDAGPGVDPEFVPRLFERYTRGSTTATHGSGLGLSVARMLAERHGGTLDYDPATQAFVIILPAALASLRQRAALRADRASVRVSPRGPVAAARPRPQ